MVKVVEQSIPCLSVLAVFLFFRTRLLLLLRKANVWYKLDTTLGVPA
jgi:hypothetical protein